MPSFDPEIIPQTLAPFVKSNQPPSSSQTAQIRAHIQYLEALPAQTAIVAQTIRRFESAVSALRRLPVEMLTEIFYWVSAGGQPCIIPYFPDHMHNPAFPALVLSRVSSLWRVVALQSPIWGNVQIRLDARTYAQAVKQAQSLFSRCPYSLLEIRIDLDNAPAQALSRASMQNIIVPHSQRIYSLCLDLDILAARLLFQLPQNSLPELSTLTLLVRHGQCAEWLDIGLEDDHNQTPLSLIAPRLTHLTISSFVANSPNCHCNLNLLSMGLRYDRLLVLELCVRTPYQQILAVLPFCSGLTALAVDLSGTLSEEDEDSDEDAPLITLPSLHSFRIVPADDTDITAEFLDRLLLPALRTFSCDSGTGEGMSNLLRRSQFRLFSMGFKGILAFHRTEFHELVSRQRHLTRLELENCGGSFTDALERQDPTLMPSLRYFAWRRLPVSCFNSFINFVNSRFLPGGVYATKLETVGVQPSGYPFDAGDFEAGSPQYALNNAISNWRALGLNVELQPCPNLDPLLYSEDSQSEVDDEEEWQTILNGTWDHIWGNIYLGRYDEAWYRYHVPDWQWVGVSLESALRQRRETRLRAYQL
ncbi:hypothetical protein R3P38DRAFT_3608564 [Favolaschia claudopus]|uniref:F-box domain-containing protein n=1 Tax=Favolaschia claudopus TaxID=2862362 RepID=A0AAW0DKK7_9AGAR